MFSKIVLFVSILFTVNLAFADQNLWIEKDKSKDASPALNIPSFAPTIQALGKSVVNIRTKGKLKTEKKIKNFKAPKNMGPWDFLLQLPEEEQDFRSLGSGFVIHPDGYIVTNYHVVENASKITISFKDEQKTYSAELVGSDKKTDLALIKVDHPGQLPAAPLGDSDKLLPGDWVLAIGNPFQLGHTATVGIISALGRKINLPGQESKPYDNFIQTDASINPGNSGGPLFNANGEVIGVNTAILGSSGGNIGIGFAIPVNLVKTIISQLKDNGHVVRGWLGVLIQPVEQDVADAMGLEEAKGALVADIVEGSPAGKAGFESGDVILSFDGRTVEKNDDLPLMVAQTEIGKEVTVGIIRAGKKMAIRVKIEELKEDKEEVAKPADEKSYFGLTVQELTPEIMQGIGVEAKSGLIVVDVEPDSEAAEAGIKPRDIILKIGSESVTSASRMGEILGDLPKDKPLLFLILRNDNTIFLTLKKKD